MTACAPLLTMGLIVELFPDKHPVTVYRWRNTNGRNRLPDPDITVGGVPMWSASTIEVWAAERKLSLNQAELWRICQSQLID